MAVAASLNVLIGAKTEEFERGMKRAENAYRGTYARLKAESQKAGGGFFDKASSPLRGLAKGIGATGGPVAAFMVGYEGAQRAADRLGELLKSVGASAQIWTNVMTPEGIDRVSESLRKTNTSISDLRRGTLAAADAAVLLGKSGLDQISEKKAAETRQMWEELKELKGRMATAPEWKDVAPGMKSSLMENLLNAKEAEIEARAKAARRQLFDAEQKQMREAGRGLRDLAGANEIEQLQRRGDEQGAYLKTVELNYEKQRQALEQWAGDMKKQYAWAGGAIDDHVKKMQGALKEQKRLAEEAPLANAFEGLWRALGEAGKGPIETQVMALRRMGATAEQAAKATNILQQAADKNRAYQMRESGAFSTPVEKLQKEMEELRRMAANESITPAELQRAMLAKGLALREMLGMGEELQRTGAVERMYSFDVPGAERAADPLKKLVELQKSQIEEDKKLGQRIVDELGTVMKFYPPP